MLLTEESFGVMNSPLSLSLELQVLTTLGLATAPNAVQRGT